MQKLLSDYPATNPVLYNLPQLTGAGAFTGAPAHKKRTHPNHRMEDNSLRVYFDMVNSGELGETEQVVINAIEQFPESTAFELSTMAHIPIRTCAARISDIFNDKKHRFPVKLIEACADRPDLYTGKIATPWRLSRRPHYYTKTELIKFRKWTPAAITEFLQYADETETNPHSDSFNALPIQLFLANRVWSVKSTDGYKAYQKEWKQKRSGGI